MLVFSSSVCLGWNEITHVNLLTGLAETSSLPFLFQLITSPITQASKLEISVIFNSSSSTTRDKLVIEPCCFHLRASSRIWVLLCVSLPLFSPTCHALFRYLANWPWWQSSLPAQVLPLCCCQSLPKKMLMTSLPFFKTADDFQLLKDQNYYT